MRHPHRRGRLHTGRTVGIRDVAAMAGVSVATVSRAFNNPDAVSEDLRMRVLALAREVGYVPNAAARELASTRSYRVGAVISTLANSIFAEFVDSASRMLAYRGYSLLLATFEFDPELETRAIEGMLAAGVEGLMLFGLRHDEAILESVEARGVACVMASILDASGRWASVGYDNREGGRMIARHLLDLGHRQIALLAGDSTFNDRAELRRVGVEEAMAQAGIAPAMILERPIAMRAGRDGFAEIMSRAPDVTAVICGNDALAAGALFEATARGLNVPRQISIAGYDCSEIALSTEPPLTTIRVPMSEMGRRTAEELIALIEGEETRMFPVELPLALVAGGSTGPAPA